MIATVIVAGILFIAMSGLVVFFYSVTLKERETMMREMRDFRNLNERTNREAYQKAKENEAAIKIILNHLDLKVVEEFDTVTYQDVFGESNEEKILTDRRIEPKTNNDKRIEELQKEIEMLRELDKELSE